MQQQQQEPEIKMVGFMHPGFAVTIDEFESTAEISNPYMGTIINLETQEIIYTAYGDYMMRLIGMLRRWLYQYLLEQAQQPARRLRYGN